MKKLRVKPAAAGISSTDVSRARQPDGRSQCPKVPISKFEETYKAKGGWPAYRAGEVAGAAVETKNAAQAVVGISRG